MRVILASLRARAADETGSVLVLTLGALFLLIVLGAIGIDAGYWFSHKRELQNQADAGALAAAVEYDKNWRACLSGDAATAQAISDKARQYAGDTSFTGGALRNNQISSGGGNVLVNINKAGFDTGSVNDYPTGTPGLGSCYLRPTGDDVSPTGGTWTDVKVKESSAPVEFNMLGISAPDITAQARVQLNPILSQNKMSPLALPVPKLNAAQMRLYSICGGTTTLLGTYDLQQLGSAHQTLASETLWGRPDASGDNQPVTINLPNAAACGSDYVRIGTEVRVTGRSTVDINGITCPSTSQQYASCWTDNGARWGPEARVWAPQTGAPTFKDVHLTSSDCSPDAYFSRVASCHSDVSVDVQWPAACTSTNPASYSVSVNNGGGAVQLTAPATPAGVWTSTGGAFTTGTGGADTYTVKWTSPNGNCAGNAGSGKTLHQDFVANDTNSGIVQLVRLTNTARVNPAEGVVSPFDSVQSVGTGNTASVYLTAGFQTAFAVGPLLKLRLDASQGNGSINCNNGSQGIKDTYDAFVLGCSKYYGVNSFAAGTWWPCPAPNAFPTNLQSAPWRCAPAAPGLSPGQIADGMAMRVGACTYTAGTYNGGCKTQRPCVPNNWVAGQTPSTTDPRLITIFLVPYGSFNGVTGGATAVPVIDFGSFYVTSWSGSSSGNDQDLCAGAITQNGTGEIDGHFVDLVDVLDQPDPTMSCDPSQLRPCLATLIR